MKQELDAVAKWICDAWEWTNCSNKKLKIRLMALSCAIFLFLQQ
jgi:hypothetical protein